MAKEPTGKELELAARINELDDAAMRPAIAGGGVVVGAANFMMKRVTRGIMSAALAIFIAYHGWLAFNSSQQLMADLQIKTAEAGKMVAEANAVTAKTGQASLRTAQLQAELENVQQQALAIKADADAQNAIVDGASVRLRTLQAELEKTQQQASAARADADAQNAIVDGAPLRLQQLRAELDKTRADAEQAKADADAQTQIIDGIPVALAQKQADVAAAQAEAQRVVTGIRAEMSASTDPYGYAMRMMQQSRQQIWQSK